MLKNSLKSYKSADHESKTDVSTHQPLGKKENGTIMNIKLIVSHSTTIDNLVLISLSPGGLADSVI